MNAKNFPIIIETKRELSDKSQGFYLNGSDVIVLRDISKQNVIIHECVHYLFDNKDKTLRKFLKAMRLDFNSKPKKVLTNRILNNMIDVKMLDELYEPYEFLNEALAYLLGESDEKIIRELNIPLLNNILDGDFFYHDLKGNVFHYKVGYITNNPKIEALADTLINDGVI